MIPIEKGKWKQESVTPRKRHSRANASKAWKKPRLTWISGKPTGPILGSTAPPSGKWPPCLPKRNPPCYLCRWSRSVITSSGSARCIPMAAWKSTPLFVPKFKFSGKRVIGYNMTAFDPTRHVKSLRSAWRTLTRKAGLPGFRFHDLRHCAITQLAENGTSDSTIMAIAGHLSRRMLERYSHVRMEAKRKAMEALAASTRMVSYDTNHDTNAQIADARLV